MKRHFCKKIGLVLLPVFFYSHYVEATDSSMLISPFNSTATDTPMVFSNVTATFQIVVNQSGAWSSGCNIFFFVAQCPPGSVPNSANDTITGTDIHNCFKNNNCKSSILGQPLAISNYTLCSVNYNSVWRLSTTVFCNLTLQGWFPASSVTPLLAGQRAAPINNFNLGNYTVFYNDQGNYSVVSTCTVTPNLPSSPTTIPSYYSLCPNSYSAALFTPP